MIFERMTKDQFARLHSASLEVLAANAQIARQIYGAPMLTF